MVFIIILFDRLNWYYDRKQEAISRGILPYSTSLPIEDSSNALINSLDQR